MNIHRIGDVTVLNDHAEVPGLGFFPSTPLSYTPNSPWLSIPGSAPPTRTSSPLLPRIDPADARWLWITHPDRDHTGGLSPLLEAAPTARLVTTFLGMGIMSLEWTVPQPGFPAQPGPGPRRR